MKHLKSTFVGLLALMAASDAFAQGQPGPWGSFFDQLTEPVKIFEDAL